MPVLVFSHEANLRRVTYLLESRKEPSLPILIVMHAQFPVLTGRDPDLPRSQKVEIDLCEICRICELF